MNATHTILNAKWTETERITRTLSSGQIRTIVHIERPKKRGKGMIQAWASQDSGAETATMSHWSAVTFQIPALSL